MIKIYGIKNCDTVKKALNFLDNNDVSYEFIDFKKIPPSIDLLLSWKAINGDFPINPKGRIFKEIKDQYLATTSDKKKAKLLSENTSAIKRPLVEFNNKIILGFSEEEYKVF
jgi:arsenate reductase (glutaredoxin)